MAMVDIFIPCYNAERFLQQTIDSIKKQTYQDYRVIVVDDGSTDHSMEILQKYAKEDHRVLIYRNDGNQGVAYTRNRGLQLCDSKYMAFMDADDIMPEYRLEKEVGYMEAHPECDVISGNYQLMDEDGRLGAVVKLGEKNTDEVYSALFFENVIANGTALFRTSFYRNHKIDFLDKYAGLEDYDFWVESMLAGAKMHIMDEVFLFYRVVQSGLSRMNSSEEKIRYRNQCFLNIHRKILDGYGIRLSEREQEMFFEYTTEVLPDKRTRRKNFWMLCKLVYELKKQNPFRTRSFINACNQFKRKAR